MQDKPRLGISACLLGQPVRFDGGHKRDTFLTQKLGPWVDWVSVCPEVGSGLGVPRPTLRLVGASEGPPRLVAPKTGIDHTEAMQRFSAKEIERLRGMHLCGFVLKSKSPSCGMERVKVYGGAVATRGGRGVFAAALIDAFPLLPIEEEGRLNDALLRENFVEQIFAYKRWQSFRAAGPTRGGMVQFHAAHKYLLLSHSPEHYEHLGHVVADMKGKTIEAVCEAYGTLLMQGLKQRATMRKHTNVLQHMLGFFKRSLGTDDRAEILGVIKDFRAGIVPLTVPMTLIRHHVRSLNVTYLAEQVYLDPTPKELLLRNHL
jgi:uncharacterized protein YbgA (DUF1722 family)/uncharacterized protein YbbK (DUF523 family)